MPGVMSGDGVLGEVVSFCSILYLPCSFPQGKGPGIMRYSRGDPGIPVMPGDSCLAGGYGCVPHG